MLAKRLKDVMAKSNIRWWNKILLVLASHLLASFAGGSVGGTIWLDNMSMTRPFARGVLPGLWWPLGVGDILFEMPHGGVGVGIFLVVVLVIVLIVSVIRFWRTQHKWYLLVFALPWFIFGVRGAKCLSQILAM
jgi:hypothetical protein